MNKKKAPGGVCGEDLADPNDKLALQRFEAAQEDTTEENTEKNTEPKPAEIN